jgi:predicted RNA binding protein YcfA (HicA-like mRNA interferase family)
VPKLPGVPHLQAVRALEKAGFRIAREGKHVVMTDGRRILTVPRNNPINAFTMGGIVRDAGLTIESSRSSSDRSNVRSNKRLKLTSSF